MAQYLQFHSYVSNASACKENWTPMIQFILTRGTNYQELTSYLVLYLSTVINDFLKLFCKRTMKMAFLLHNNPLKEMKKTLLILMKLMEDYSATSDFEFEAGFEVAHVSNLKLHFSFELMFSIFFNLLMLLKFETHLHFLVFIYCGNYILEIPLVYGI